VTESAAVLDSDILSEISRGHPAASVRARDYLHRHGRFTVTAVTLYERLRGYRAALRAGRPLEAQLRQFEALAATFVVLPLDAGAADRAASIWGALGPRARRAERDILIAAIASVHGLPVVTRNRRDYAPIVGLDFVKLKLLDWTA
jgi:predicted nucleic acid-binding protein